MEDLSEILKKHGFAFKKKFGQNFIADRNLLEAIVRDAGVDKNTTVLEIGAGAGALTRAVSEAAGRVLSYEIDRTLAPVLAETLAGCDNTEVVFRDFMKEDMAKLEEELGPYVVCANLPYYVTTPVLLRFLEEAKLCRSVTVMVQEEVAERLCAREGTPEYGAITAAIALRGRAQTVRKVPRTMFYPRPNVDSAVVVVSFGGGVPVKSAAAYRFVVRAAFSGRRKTLENNLMNALHIGREEAHSLLTEAGVKDGVRGETLSPLAFARLADVLTEKGMPLGGQGGRS